MRFTVDLYFPEDRKEYTDPTGRPFKIQDYQHWQQWIKDALLRAPDGAMMRCGAKVQVKQDPELEPVQLKCYKCGEITEVSIRGLADVDLPVSRYPKGAVTEGYICPDWGGGRLELHDNDYRYVCDRCGATIFDNLEQLEDYVKVHGNADSVLS